MTDAASLAERFWRDAGGPAEFPRDVASAAGWALPLLVTELPGLTTAAAGTWLRARGIAVPLLPDRPLRACLVARAGQGVILLDAGDCADERRYSAAHEVAHFLRDHLAFRDRTRRSLGDAALEVLDGVRAATSGERLDALFADLRLRPAVHLLDRDPSGGCRSLAAAEAEAAAERLALELLAPRAAADRVLASFPFTSPADDGPAAARLAAAFGLPPGVARPYARRLLADRAAARPLREWLRSGTPLEKLQTSCRTLRAASERRSPGG